MLALSNDLAVSSEELLIPSLFQDGAYTTQFVLFSGRDSGSSGTMKFLDQNGQPAGVNFH